MFNYGPLPSSIRPPWIRGVSAAGKALATCVALTLGSSCTGQLNFDDTSKTPPDVAAPDSGAATPDLLGAPPENFAFEPVSVRVYLTKVKNLLLGQAPTDDEVAAVTKDATALRGLVDAWFVKPEAQAKFFNFYQKAFQQTQVISDDFLDQGGLQPGFPQFQQAQDSFARTVQQLVADGQSFRSTVTTHKFMMTPALMAQYLLIDQTMVDDSGAVSMSLPAPDGSLLTKNDFYVTYLPPAMGGPITLQQTLDPKSPYYLHFAVPQPFTCNVPQLDQTGHVVVDLKGKAMQVKVTYNERHYNKLPVLFSALFGLAAGSIDGSNGNGPPPPPVIPADVPANMRFLYYQNCGGNVGYTPPYVTAADSVWRPVTVRVATQGEPLVPFYDLAALRTANEIVVRMPRVGFFSTPAFFANWQTNKSNQQRDTMNQTLIVALGRSINPVDKGTSTILDNGKDGQHSDPTSPCYSCHQTMDPMRNVFRQAFTYSYHAQTDPTQLFSTATFDYLGMRAPMASLDDLATTLITHPLYPIAWTQKLCYYANSSACSEDDPEFVRVTKAFANSNFDFHTLVRELFSSPLVTGASKTKTWTDLGETITVARQDHFCASLTNRLQLPSNICSKISKPTIALAVANNIPFDGYLRGAEAPALSTDATLFYRGASEALCSYAADLTVDASMSRYSSTKKDQAITDFVANIMGVTSGDPNNAPVTKLLSDHFDAAVAAGGKPGEALKSTFIVACMSPTSIAMGL